MNLALEILNDINSSYLPHHAAEVKESILTEGLEYFLERIAPSDAEIEEAYEAYKQTIYCIINGF